MRLSHVAVAFLLTTGAAHASPAGDFLKELDGKWRGGGTLISESGSKQTKVRCSLRNAFAPETLKIEGRCASSAGTRPVRGALEGSASGIKSGTIRLPGIGRMRNVVASLQGKTLVLTGTVKRGGKSVPVRNRISRNGNKLSLQVQSKKGGSWTDGGTLLLRR